LYFNTTEKKTKVYSNSAWGDLGGGSLWTASSTNIYYNTGNVGIGTTGPSSKFTVIGAWPQAYFTNTTGASYGVVIGKNAAGSWGEIGAHHWNGSVYDTWADLILQTGGGNVGIGKTNPGTALDVAGTVTATQFVTTADVTATAASHFAIQTASDNYIRWQTPANAKISIGLGNVDNTADSVKSVLYAASAGSTLNKTFKAWQMAFQDSTTRCYANPTVAVCNTFCTSLGGTCVYAYDSTCTSATACTYARVTCGCRNMQVWEPVYQ
jgi:hypothetical protein